MQSPQDHVAAVHRRVGSVERDVASCHLVELTTRIAAPVAQVWAALTDADRISTWFGPIEGDLRVGGPYRLENNASGTVLVCDPDRTFELSWEFDGAISWVQVTLGVDGADASTLILGHTLPDDAQWEEFGPGATGMGWEMARLGLVEHLAAPTATRSELLRPLEGATGIEFYGVLLSAGAAGWRDADVAAGTDPGIADLRARRCLDAYTGGAGELL